MYQPTRALLLAALISSSALLAAPAVAQAPPGPRAEPSDSPAPAAADDDATSPDADAPLSDDELPPPPPLPGEEAAAPAPPSGDVVTMKNGKVLQGVQVVRESPMKVDVQVVPGVDPISIPRKQVVSIQYDDLGPDDVKEGAPAGGASTPGGMGKGKVSPELAQKLGKAVTDAEMQIQNRDIIEVLREFAAKVEADFEAEPQVQQMPANERMWTATIPAGTSLMTVLVELLPKDFPQIEADITESRVILQEKGEAEEEEEAGQI